MRAIIGVWLTMLLGLGLFGQSTASSTFEVASIKPTKPGTGPTIRMEPGSIRITSMTLKNLITFAYGIRAYQVSAGPGWIDGAVYDIAAKTSGPPTIEAQRPKLQQLLADRFQLKFHRQTTQVPVYVLAQGKNGSKLRPAKEGDKLGGSTLSLPMLATSLSQELDRPVVDQTGLKGNYHVILKWAKDDGQPRGFGVQDGPNPVPLAFDPAGPSIFTAVQEQLGLILRSDKGPIEVLVIDRIERPSEN